MMEDDRPSSNLSVRASEIVKSALEYASKALQSSDEQRFADYKIRDIDWISCQDFTIDLGKQQIEEYIHTWEMHPSWLFSLEFLEENEVEFLRQYRYRARWSIPTRRTPLPRSACVYFLIQISKIKPQTLPVEVQFWVESNRLTHTPGKTRFREKWLKDVIESKALLQDSVSF